MTLSTKIEVFYRFYICLQWAFIHALLSRVHFALAGLSCLVQIQNGDQRLRGLKDIGRAESCVFRQTAAKCKFPTEGCLLVLTISHLP